MRKHLIKKLVALMEGKGEFDSLALEVFDYQYQNNKIYREYADLLGINPGRVNTIEKIPFLPIEFFKSHQIKSATWDSQKVFFSSGTGQAGRSAHHIRATSWYERVAVSSFATIFGSPENYAWLGLLPNYLQQGNSSLIYMINHFHHRSIFSSGGLFENPDELFFEELEKINKEGYPAFLIGVSFALLDLAESGVVNLPDNWIVMETGGMKGRRRELIREELHEKLKIGLGTKGIHSEYGMTELQSQAYSKGNGRFQAGPLMRVLVREINDPLTMESIGTTGALNIIDLANLDSCSFVMTQDLGRNLNEGFEVLGRMDGTELRGCNLMYFG